MPRAREHSREFTKAFAPVRIFLILIGQMPFEVKHREDGTTSFKFNKKGRYTLLFGVVFILSTLNYILVSAGILTFFGKANEHKQKHITTKALESAGPHNIHDPTSLDEQSVTWETYYSQRQLVTIVVVWSWMTIALVGSSYILLHGKYYVHYFNYWNRVIQVMDMDVTSGIKEFLIFENITFAAILITFITLYCVPGVVIVNEVSAVLANFYFRTFGLAVAEGYNNTEIVTDHKLYRTFGFIIMLYGYAGSRANIIQFLFFVRCLTNASKIWNERLKKALTRKGEFTPEELTAQRLEHRLILKDHYSIVQLFKMTDNLFSRTLLTYYSLQIMTVVMELYQLATLRTDVEFIRPYIDPGIEVTTTVRSAATGIPQYLTRTGEKKENEDWDRALQSACFVLVLLTQGIYFTMFTTRTAARAYEEAMNGFNILRRTNYLSCDSKTERNFVHSLVFSYARNNPLNVTAGGYFAVDKTLVPSVNQLVGTVLNYVVAVYTLQPDRGSIWEIEDEVTVQPALTTTKSSFRSNRY